MGEGQLPGLALLGLNLGILKALLSSPLLGSTIITNMTIMTIRATVEDSSRLVSVGTQTEVLRIIFIKHI